MEPEIVPEVSVSSVLRTDNPCWGSPTHCSLDHLMGVRRVTAKKKNGSTTLHTSTPYTPNAFCNSSYFILYHGPDAVVLDKPPDLRMDGPYEATVEQLWYRYICCYTTREQQQQQQRLLLRQRAGGGEDNQTEERENGGGCCSCGSRNPKKPKHRSRSSHSGSQRKPNSDNNTNDDTDDDDNPLSDSSSVRAASSSSNGTHAGRLVKPTPPVPSSNSSCSSRRSCAAAAAATTPAAAAAAATTAAATTPATASFPPPSSSFSNNDDTTTNNNNDTSQVPLLFRPCHQLDYATSGCLLVARNRPTANAVRGLLQDDRGRIRKTYTAVLWGHIGGGGGCVVGDWFWPPMLWNPPPPLPFATAAVAAAVAAVASSSSTTTTTPCSNNNGSSVDDDTQDSSSLSFAQQQQQQLSQALRDMERIYRKARHKSHKLNLLLQQSTSSVPLQQTWQGYLPDYSLFQQWKQQQQQAKKNSKGPTNAATKTTNTPSKCSKEPNHKKISWSQSDWKQIWTPVNELTLEEQEVALGMSWKKLKTHSAQQQRPLPLHDDTGEPNRIQTTTTCQKIMAQFQTATVLYNQLKLEKCNNERTTTTMQQQQGVELPPDGKAPKRYTPSDWTDSFLFALPTVFCLGTESTAAVAAAAAAAVTIPVSQDETNITHVKILDPSTIRKPEDLTEKLDNSKANTTDTTQTNSTTSMDTFYICAPLAQVQDQFAMGIHPETHRQYLQQQKRQQFREENGQERFCDLPVGSLERGEDFKPSLTKCTILQRTFLRLPQPPPSSCGGCGDGPTTTASSAPGSEFGQDQQHYKKMPVTLVQMEPLTGRRHQLRVHAALMGHGIVGDCTYVTPPWSSSSSSSSSSSTPNGGGGPISDDDSVYGDTTPVESSSANQETTTRRSRDDTVAEGLQSSASVNSSSVRTSLVPRLCLHAASIHVPGLLSGSGTDDKNKDLFVEAPSPFVWHSSTGQRDDPDSFVEISLF